MKICPHCGSQNVDGAFSCSACSADISYVQPVNNAYQNNSYQAPPYQNNQAPPYQNYQAPPQQPYNQSPYGYNTFDPVVSKLNNEIQNAKTLGIVSVVFIFIMRLVTFVCALIGMSKAKAAKIEAEQLGNQMLVKEAQDAYKTNKIALIVTIVLYALGILSTIAFFVIYMGIMGESIDSLGDYM